jgi:hypothetical protein
LANLGDIVQKIRSKNAGPFWLTVDIFCGTADAYDHVIAKLPSAAVAKAFGMNTQDIKRFDIADLHVVKFSLPLTLTCTAPLGRHCWPNCRSKRDII